MRPKEGRITTTSILMNYMAMSMELRTTMMMEIMAFSIINTYRKPSIKRAVIVKLRTSRSQMFSQLTLKRSAEPSVSEV